MKTIKFQADQAAAPQDPHFLLPDLEVQLTTVEEGDLSEWQAMDGEVKDQEFVTLGQGGLRLSSSIM